VALAAVVAAAVAAVAAVAVVPVAAAAAVAAAVAVAVVIGGLASTGVEVARAMFGEAASSLHGLVTLASSAATVVALPAVVVFAAVTAAILFGRTRLFARS
jgi:hypothetical protein